MFTAAGECPTGDVLYKKSVCGRGSFRPITNTTLYMLAAL